MGRIGSLLTEACLGQRDEIPEDQKAHLPNYLLDCCLEICNNCAERSIKTCVIDCNNFLVADRPGDAKGSVVIVDPIQTTIESGRDL